MNIVVLHNQVPEDAPKDELDNLNQAAEVTRVLLELGYFPSQVPFSLDLPKVITTLRTIGPDAVFNLVESIEGRCHLLHVAPAILKHIEIPFTGSGCEAMMATTNKTCMKRTLLAAGIPTPPWWLSGETRGIGNMEGWCILKPMTEHGSVGLDEDSIVYIDDSRSLLREIKAKEKKSGHECFAERYIDGRELNISVLASGDGPEVLPAAEILFDSYFENKKRIVDYRAKWEEESFEYMHTRRGFEFPETDHPVLESIRQLAVECWRLFDLGGYARIDFRIDQRGMPFIIDVNANPCLTPDGGFCASGQRVGLSFEGIVRRILDDSFKRNRRTPEGRTNPPGQ